MRKQATEYETLQQLFWKTDTTVVHNLVYGGLQSEVPESSCSRSGSLEAEAKMEIHA